ncbi:Swi5-domain-containing protein [Pyrenochaeta sp. DS3sAY3a]|nr:Swi5-domain-containing protein [Pyrenochaeta sp. DS3sAY3a]
MAIGDDSREIPDSEDEPMTSSPVVPVNVSDGLSDKLSVTASAPHQAPQDAPQEANSPSKDAVEPGCSLFPASVRCLHVDRNIASLNVEPPSSEFDHLHPHNSVPQVGANNSLVHNASIIIPAEQEQIPAPTSQNLGPQISDKALNNENLVQQIHPTSALFMEAIEKQSTSETDRTLSFESNSEIQSLSSSAHQLMHVMGEVSSTSDPLLSIHQTYKGQQDDAIDVGVKMADADGPHDELTVEESGTKSPGPLLTCVDRTCVLAESPNSATTSSGARTGVVAETTAASPQAHINDVENDTIVPPASKSPNSTQVYQQGSSDTNSNSRFFVEPQIIDGPATVIAHQNQALEVGDNSHQDDRRVARSCDISSSLEAACETHNQGHEPTEHVGIIEKPSLIQDTDVLVNEMSNQVQLAIAPMEKTLAERNEQPRISQTDDGSRAEKGHLQAEAESRHRQTTAPATDNSLSYEQDTRPRLQHSGQSAPALPPPIHPKTSQENILAELKAQKSALLASLMTLPAIQVLVEENASSKPELVTDEDEPTEIEISAAADKLVKDHIKLLHEYNELKDVGQGLMGLIADQRGVRIVEVQDEFGMDAKD